MQIVIAKDDVLLREGLGLAPSDSGHGRVLAVPAHLNS